MRILVYGFGAYKNFRENITAAVIKNLTRQRGLRKVVFPVRFSRRQFIAAVNDTKPDLILGLGQSKRRGIEFESRARNRRRGVRAVTARPIEPFGPRWMPTTLDIKSSKTLGRSSDAGDYVCNFSMYVILSFLRQQERSTLFTFVHIPYNYKLEKAVGVVSQLLERSRKTSRR